MSVAQKLLDEVTKAGCRARIKGDMLRLNGPRPLPGALMEQLRKHKAELLALLADWNNLPTAPTEPFNQQALDAIKAGNAAPVWSGVLNEWIWFVRDNAARERLIAEGCKLAVYSLGELALVASTDKQSLRKINAFKRRFGATVEGEQWK